MSQTEKKMLALNLEFIDSTAHGMIKWVDLMTGDILSELGLGSTGNDNEGNDTGDDKYIEWNTYSMDYIKIGGNLRFKSGADILSTSTILEDEYISSGIKLNSPDYSSIEKANVLYIKDEELEVQSDRYIELEEIKERYDGNTNTLNILHENSITFSNPVSNRLLGEIDTIKETFVWYGGFSLGSVVDDSYFEVSRTDPNKLNFTLNSDANNRAELGFKDDGQLRYSLYLEEGAFNIKNTNGIGFSVNTDGVTFTDEILYKGSTLDDRYYTKTQLNDGQMDDRYYTQVEVDAKLALKSDKDHNHDSEYYSKASVDSKLNILDVFDVLPLEPVIGYMCIFTGHITNLPVIAICTDVDTWMYMELIS